MKKKIFSEEDELKIINNYNNGISSLKLAKQYNCNLTTILRLLKEKGISIKKSHEYKKYFVNEDYFDKIETLEQAYIYGWMLSDGSNYRKRNRISLTLQEQDVDILLKIKDILNYEGPLYCIKNKTNNKNYYSLSINSKKMSEDLEKLGCIENKTFKIKFPSLTNKSLTKCFIQGIWEGDGHISREKCCMAGTKDLCENIQKVIIEEVQINCKVRPIKKCPGIYELAICGGKQNLKFVKWLYDDCKIYLNRKYNKYLEILKYRNPNHLLNNDGSPYTLEQKRVYKNKRLKEWRKNKKINKDSSFLLQELVV